MPRHTAPPAERSLAAADRLARPRTTDPSDPAGKERPSAAAAAAAGGARPLATDPSVPEATPRPCAAAAPAAGGARPLATDPSVPEATPRPCAAAAPAAAPAAGGPLRLAGARRLVAVGRLPASSPIAPAAGRAAGAITPRVSPRGRRHAAATLVAGSTSAPVGAAAKGGA